MSTLNEPVTEGITIIDERKAKKNIWISFALVVLSQLLFANWQMLIKNPIDIIDAFGGPHIANMTWSGNAFTLVFPHVDYAVFLAFGIRFLLFILMGYEAWWFSKNRIVEFKKKAGSVFEFIIKYFDLVVILLFLLLDLIFNLINH